MINFVQSHELIFLCIFHQGSILPLFVIVISWRLSVLLPFKPDQGVSSIPVSDSRLSTHQLGFENEMEEMNVTYASPNNTSQLGKLQPPIPSYETEILY